MSRSVDFIPFLFTLRDPDGVDILEAFVKQLTIGRIVKKGVTGHAKRKSARLLLLADGYDEVSVVDRGRVSRALRDFHTLGCGHFFLTCRTHYDVIDLNVDYFGLMPFKYADSRGLITAFANAYGVEIEPDALLRELEEHGFQDFASHPLLLVLVCILKSSPAPLLPRRAIGLIRRAIDTLTLRWDEAKGVYRTSRIPLDGEERVRCLMRIAYHMKRLEGRTEEVERYANDYLRLVQMRGFDARAFLREMSQWYGLLVESSNDHWQFVHRTIQDYLAARFWVEDGRFDPDKVGYWDVRAAYAACLSPDASRSISKMLRNAGDISAFCECLYNAAPFDPDRVAKEVLNRCIRKQCFTYQKLNEGIAVNSGEDFFSYATPEFLCSLIRVGLNTGGPAGEMLAAYAMAECKSRKLTFGRNAIGLTPSILAAWERIEVIRYGEVMTFRPVDILRST